MKEYDLMRDQILDQMVKLENLLGEGYPPIIQVFKKKYFKQEIDKILSDDDKPWGHLDICRDDIDPLKKKDYQVN